MEVENTPEVEETIEAPEAEVAEPAEAEEAEEQVVSPEPETETLILGKYKSQEELEKAYLNAQKELTKTKQAQKDPQYVYELAKKAGLTNEEAQAEAEKVDINTIVDQTVQERLAAEKDYNRALDILPELGTDATIEAWGRALVDSGLTHEEAAKTIKAKMATSQEAARAEGAKLKEVEISEKEAAQTAPSIGNVDSESQEIETLQAKAKSLNRQEQDEALAELIMKRL